MRSSDRRSILRLALFAGLTVLAGPATALAQTAEVSAEQRVRDLKLQLPRFDTPSGGNNLPYVQSGNLVFLAGLGPRNPDGSYISGRLGKDTSVEQAYQHARLAGLRALSTLRDGLGSLDKVSRVVKLLGMVNATPDFTDPGRVINGCSDLLVEVFGAQRGRHARTVMGVASLPFNITVEIDLVVEVA
jgi:enamine deaminase RidA (YjgF/YER057c/UK114 family)